MTNEVFEVGTSYESAEPVLSNLLTLRSSRLALYFGHRTSFLNVSTDVAVSFRLGCSQPAHFRESTNPKSYLVGSPVQLRVRKLFSFEPLEMKTSTPRNKIHCSIATQFHYRVFKRE